MTTTCGSIWPRLDGDNVISFTPWAVTFSGARLNGLVPVSTWSLTSSRIPGPCRMPVTSPLREPSNTDAGPQVRYSKIASPGIVESSFSTSSLGQAGWASRCGKDKVLEHRISC